MNLYYLILRLTPAPPDKTKGGKTRPEQGQRCRLRHRHTRRLRKPLINDRNLRAWIHAKVLGLVDTQDPREGGSVK